MNPKIKISQLPAKGSNLAAADLLEVAEFTGTGYISKSITGQEIIDAAVGNVDWGDIGGTLSAQTDLNTALSGKVPTSRTLTINGTTQDLSADRTFTISTGITIGTTAITSGTVGRVLFQGTGNVVSQSANLFWDNTNGRLGIGTASPAYALEVKKSLVGDHGTNIQNTSNSTSARSFFQISNDTSQYAEFLLNSSTYTGPTRFGITGQAAFMDANVTTILGTIGANSLIFGTNNTERVRVFGSTGNIGINTTTDAGFRLDVNGTARFSGSFTQSGSSLISTISGFWYVQNTGNATTFGSYESQQGMTYRSGQPFCINVANGSHATSATVQIDSTTKGFLPPRMTTTQKNAIATPAAGLMVYDTTLNLISYYNGTSWI